VSPFVVGTQRPRKEPLRNLSRWLVHNPLWIDVDMWRSGSELDRLSANGEFQAKYPAKTAKNTAIGAP